MSDKNDFVESLVDLAKTVGPMIVPGASEMIALGEKVLATIDKAKGMFDGEVPVPLEAERAALEIRVKGHVSKTASRLRGN